MVSQTGALNFGQQIEQDMVQVWANVEAFGEKAITGLESLADNEVTAVKNAAIALLGNFVPAQIALVEGWVKEVATELGSGVGIEEALTGVLNKDSAAETSFLAGEKTIALQALVAAFLSAL